MSNPNPPDNDDSASLDDAIANGLAAVTAAAHALAGDSTAVSCRDVGRVFDTAIEHGAPIWNRGSQVGCARIYLQAAHDLLAQLRRSDRPRDESSPAGVNAVPIMLQRVVEEFPTANEENANRLGWALRGIFDRFHAARGIEDVDQLIDATLQAGGAVDMDLIGLCLTVAIAHGNILYQAEALDACAVLHELTARRALWLLDKREKEGGSLTAGLGLVRRELTPVAADPAGITDNAEAMAWKYYEAFQKILRIAPEYASRKPASEYQGFISYRRTGGSDAALAVRAHLQMRGLNTFLDVEGLDSGTFGPRLLRAIEQAPSFLLILTPGSLERCQHPNDWLRLEIAHAIQMGRTIIPIMKDGFQFPDAESLPPEIRALPGYQAVTYSHEFFVAVIDRIEKYMRSASP